MTKKILLSALKKINHSQGREYCGYMTPSEFLILAKEIELSDKNHYVIIAQKLKNKGKGNSHWYYFATNKKFEELMKKNGFRATLNEKIK